MNFFYFHFPTTLIMIYSFRIFVMIDKENRFRRLQDALLLGIYVAYVVLQYVFNVGTIAEQMRHTYFELAE